MYILRNNICACVLHVHTCAKVSVDWRKETRLRSFICIHASRISLLVRPNRWFKLAGLHFMMEMQCSSSISAGWHLEPRCLPSYIRITVCPLACRPLEWKPSSKLTFAVPSDLLRETLSCLPRRGQRFVFTERYFSRTRAFYLENSLDNVGNYWRFQVLPVIFAFTDSWG